jgi:hypothetical protein
MTRKKRTRRTGASLLAAFGICLLAGAAALAGTDKKSHQPFGLVAGTVFTEAGRALPGAEVVLQPAATNAKDAAKSKKSKYMTDARGEFAIRVPAAKQEYLLKFSAPGFEPQEKAVTISGEDRVDVFVRLQAASK